MTGIYQWAFALGGLILAVAIVLRALRIVRAVCAAPRSTPVRHDRTLPRRAATNLRTFFAKTVAAIVHTVLVASFLLMLADLFLHAPRIVFSHTVLATPATPTVFDTVNATLAAAAILCAGILLLRRYVLRLPRFAGLTPAQRKDATIILLLEMASAGSYLLTYFISPHIAYAHYAIMLVFGLYITYSKHLHIFTAPLYLLLTGRRAAFTPQDMPEVAAGLDILQGSAPATGSMPERMGAKYYTDLPRREIIAALACTECGRCDQACPAARTVPSFSPRKTVASLRRCALSGGEEALFGPQGISAEEAFACISCGACLNACPIAIDPSDTLLQLRRYASLEQGSAPAAYGRAAATIAATGNPWGFNPPANAGGLPTADPDAPTPYLLWRGPMGLFDPAGKNAVAALAQALAQSGVSFSALPESEETAPADILRQTGDEFTFLAAARQNIATLRRYGVRHIVTPCPHSLTAFRNYYPALGGHYTVEHATDTLYRLIDEGHLKVSRTLAGKTVVFHDPCRLSRAGMTETPRRIIRLLGGRIVEAPHHGQDSYCCGGGDYFAADEKTSAIARTRLHELAATGAELIVTACPVCQQMLSAADPEKKGVPVADICTLIRPEA